jgi:hypothetical protein
MLEARLTRRTGDSNDAKDNTLCWSTCEWVYAVWKYSTRVSHMLEARLTRRTGDSNDVKTTRFAGLPARLNVSGSTQSGNIAFAT